MGATNVLTYHVLSRFGVFARLAASFAVRDEGSEIRADTKDKFDGVADRKVLHHQTEGLENDANGCERSVTIRLGTS